MKVGKSLEIYKVNKETLAQYCDIPAWFEVRSKLEIEMLNDGYGGMVFRERTIAAPYKKYYGDTDEPLRWPEKFNTSEWVVFLVREGEKPVGGLTIACKTAELWMLGGRSDLACVWDIRVYPEYRRHGVGTQLFQKAIEWSREQGYRQLCVETQNVNVPACRFYLKQGCKLGAINLYAYFSNPALADEVQLIWFMDL